MKIIRIIGIFVLAGVLTFAMAADFDVMADEILEEIWDFHPIAATHLGRHEHDARMPDYSAKALQARCERLEQWYDAWCTIDTIGMPPERRVDYILLKASLYDEIYDIREGRVYEKNPLVYVQACVYGVYTILTRHASDPDQKAAAVIARLNQLPYFLKCAMENLKRPAVILCEVGVDQLNEGERFIEDVFGHFSDSLSPERVLEFQRAKTIAVAAMMQFGYWLQKNGDPDAVYALGREGYDLKLHNVHLLDIDADSLLRVGEYYLRATGAMIDSLTALLKPPLRQMVVLPPDFGPAQVVEYREEELRDVRDFVAASGVLTIPAWVGDIKIVETPSFLVGLVPGVAIMPPGAFDKLRTSYFYTPRLPVVFDRNDAEYYYNYIHNRWFRESAVHEAYPGHHLQKSIANNHPSAVRKSFGDYFLVEGWALYCEELMVLIGYYEDTVAAMINALEGVRYRAARVVVDVKLQTRSFTYEDALRFMVDNFGGSEGYYSREVKRYISNPIQPSSYLIGKLQLQSLLEEYRSMKGSEFRLRDFHDELLSHGSIPIKLIRRLMIGG
ncbi:MAG: DUF885 domain-containing protein [candidate division WOR-3 bacterium]|nr:MAG: DUF885 domain-containing protein [candidate division WOR-3 bacterium]